MPDTTQRNLGVVEAFMAVRDQCPSGAARAVAVQALEAIKEREPGSLRQQSYFVLSAIRGWRGDRARQVHDSLQFFLRGEQADSDD